jgi:hypothetical protein
VHNVQADGGDPARALDLVALDSLHGCHSGASGAAALQSEGVQVIDCELAQRDEPARVNAAHFAQLLVSLC